MSDVKTLSDATVKEIEDFLGEELQFISAFGINGNSLPLRPKSVKAKILDLKKNPIKTQEIFQIESFSLVGYTGSHVCAWVLGGVLYEFTHPH